MSNDMPRQLTISIPHNLSESEVQPRITGAIADARRKHPTILAGAHETWSGNRMDFRFSALGQTITGDIVIEPRTVHLNINLPWALSVLAERMRPQIEAEGRKLLTESKDRPRKGVTED